MTLFYHISFQYANHGLNQRFPNHVERCSEIKADREFKRNIRVQIFKMIATGDYSSKQVILGSVAYVCNIEPEFKTKVIQYIMKTIDKFIYFSELVKIYNENLMYDMKPEIEKNISDLYDFEDEEVMEDELIEIFSIREDREKYLKKLNIKDICEYTGWPQICDCEVEDEHSPGELPF